jgi:hypothetical protein
MSGEATSRVGRFAPKVLILLTAVVLLAHGTARAETSLASALEGVIELPSTEEALSDVYGQAMIAELRRLMSRHLDAVCLKSRPSSDAILKKAAGDILLRYGRKAIAIRSPKIDYTQVADKFGKIAGPAAVADLTNPAAIDAMRRYQAMSLQVSRVAVVELIADGFDRYLYNANLSLGETLDPLTSGNEELATVAMESRDRFSAELQKASSKDAALQRVRKHLDAVDTAYREIVLTHYKNVGPELFAHVGFRGVEVELRNACVRLGK